MAEDNDTTFRAGNLQVEVGPERVEIRTDPGLGEQFVYIELTAAEALELARHILSAYRASGK